MLENYTLNYYANCGLKSLISAIFILFRIYYIRFFSSFFNVLFNSLIIKEKNNKKTSNYGLISKDAWKELEDTNGFWGSLSERVKRSGTFRKIA